MPEQKKLFLVSEKIRKRVHNLPDPTRPPLGYDKHKGFDRVFPYIRLPRLHPPNHGDTVIFNAPELPANQLILGDNLQVLRTIPSETVDLINLCEQRLSAGDSIDRYIKVLRKYIEDNNLPMEIDLIPLDSKEFRKRILQRYQDVEDAEFYLRFSKPPVIGDIKVKKLADLEYEFEAVDTFSSNEDGYLVSCQWDFDYQVGHFAGDKDYILSRQKVKLKGKDERFEAILTAKHEFEKEGSFAKGIRLSR